jgi:excisionase family DNA binding protein
MPTQLLTLAEVADELRISVDCVRRKIWARQLAGLKIGGLVRISRADLDDYLIRSRKEVQVPNKALVS